MACTAKERNVLILGKVGSGKRTLGNRIVGGETRLFKQESGLLGTRNVDAHYGECTRGDTCYRIQTIDTESLQTRFNDPIQHIKKETLQNIHLIIFAIPKGLYTDESHRSLQRAVESLNERAMSVSALVITRCEEIENSERGKIVAEFCKNPVSSKVVALMEKGICALGFPDTSIMPPNVKPILQQGITHDEEAIRQLVESCDSPIRVENLERQANTAKERNVLILGKVGSGKRTLGNHIAGGETHLFKHESGHLGTGNVDAHYGECTRGDTCYRIQTIDTESLQTRFNDPIQHIKKETLQNIHLIIFAIPKGLYTDESHRSLQRAVESLNKRSMSVSALVITHCEDMENSERERIVAEFSNNPVSSKVVVSMGKGIYALGFPDTSIMPPNVKPIMQQRITHDEETIRQLVESCDSPIRVEDVTKRCYDLI